jgi:hypothetical protein
VVEDHLIVRLGVFPGKEESPRSMAGGRFRCTSSRLCCREGDRASRSIASNRHIAEVAAEVDVFDGLLSVTISAASFFGFSAPAGIVRKRLPSPR